MKQTTLDEVNASPTKEFFIEMLTKDIQLIPAIMDLVDNSIDGARRIRHNSDFSGLFVKIKFDKNSFTIQDNCGGIEAELARSYAFRFGRPKGMSPTKHSVGQFGVGMKRALFKLGRKFTIESVHKKSHFELSVDVTEWKENPDDWTFHFSDHASEENNEVTKTGTTITISHLHPSVLNSLVLENFEGRLRDRIERDHQFSLDQGLEIFVNGLNLETRLENLVASSDIQPAKHEFTRHVGDHEIHIELIAGIADSDSESAGWYIFCNGRLIVGPDQSSLSGWGEGKGHTIPKFHGQFSRFRGYAFFDSDFSDDLPWNTTKTNVDGDSELFRSIRSEMILLMRPVINFLNDLDRENDLDEVEERILSKAIEQTSSISVKQVPAKENFSYPQTTAPPKKEKHVTIMYKRPKGEIEQLKDKLKLSSNREVGVYTYEYYLDLEGLD